MKILTEQRNEVKYKEHLFSAIPFGIFFVLKGQTPTKSIKTRPIFFKTEDILTDNGKVLTNAFSINHTGVVPTFIEASEVIQPIEKMDIGYTLEMEEC